VTVEGEYYLRSARELRGKKMKMWSRAEQKEICFSKKKEKKKTGGLRVD
jgi:hypothetical protein